jgi:hypothetical protein
MPYSLRLEKRIPPTTTPLGVEELQFVIARWKCNHPIVVKRVNL